MDETLHTVIWFELWVDDVELARQFYGDLFGWTFAPMAEYDPQHWLIDAGEGRGTIGALWPSDARPSDAGAVVYVAAASLDASVTRAREIGASLVRKPTSVPDGTSFALIRDPCGTLLGRWSNAAR